MNMSLFVNIIYNAVYIFYVHCIVFAHVYKQVCTIRIIIEKIFSDLD